MQGKNKDLRAEVERLKAVIYKERAEFLAAGAAPKVAQGLAEESNIRIPDDWPKGGLSQAAPTKFSVCAECGKADCFSHHSQAAPKEKT